MIESVVSLATLSQFLCITAMSILLMSEKGVMLVSVCDVR